MPHLWKSAKNADFHKVFGKASQKTLSFPTFSTMPTAISPSLLQAIKADQLT